MLTWIAGISSLWVAAAGPPEEVVKQYAELSYTYTGGDYQDEAFRYRLLRPEPLEEGRQYPLVLFLHGAGERGDDNQKQLLYLPSLMSQGPWRLKYPCFLLAPQCRAGKWWTNIARTVATDGNLGDPTEQMQVVEAVLRLTLDSEPVDRQRVYLTGLSMGGFGSWELAARHPEWFAALVPICGGGQAATAERIKQLPIWAFHGAEDKVVPPSRSRVMIEALKSLGATAKYSELEGVGHDSWTPAYEQPNGVLDWMFQQTRSRPVNGG